MNVVQVNILVFEKNYMPSTMQIMFVIHDSFWVLLLLLFYLICVHRHKVDCYIFSLNGEKIHFVYCVENVKS